MNASQQTALYFTDIYSVFPNRFWTIMEHLIFLW
jgi:hypothetical protein